MTDFGPHAFYIFAAYFGVAVVTAGLVAMIVFDNRAKVRDLSALETKRNRRRGDPA